MKFPSRKVFSRGSLQKSLALQPVYLGASVSPDYIRLLILEIPGNDDNHVTLSDPDPLLHLAWYAGHPGNAVDAPHLYAIGAKQAFHMTEYLSILFAGETNSSNYSSFFFPPLTTFIQLITSIIITDIRLMISSRSLCLEQPKHLSCALALKTTLK
jgi:hypothetical protein